MEKSNDDMQDGEGNIVSMLSDGNTTGYHFNKHPTLIFNYLGNNWITV